MSIPTFNLRTMQGMGTELFGFGGGYEEDEDMNLRKKRIEMRLVELKEKRVENNERKVHDNL